MIETRTLKKALLLLNRRQKLSILGVFFSSLVVLCVDLASVGSILPLIEGLTKDETLLKYSSQYNLSGDLIIFGLATVILLSLVSRFLLNSYVQWVSKSLSWSISTQLFESMLSAPYTFFFRNRSEGLQRTILQEADLFVSVIIAFTTLCTNLIAFSTIAVFALWSFGKELQY